MIKTNFKVRKSFIVCLTFSEVARSDQKLPHQTVKMRRRVVKTSHRVVKIRQHQNQVRNAARVSRVTCRRLVPVPSIPTSNRPKNDAQVSSAKKVSKFRTRLKTKEDRNRNLLGLQLEDNQEVNITQGQNKR